ncbi:DUF669 domain-containing protein [Kozakia baliensis]|uniref:DUF669 domain-containing protein n=1 Tax=Kozakia baliensis TaxID=153496 RepID=UPI000497B429|nr:DUF669 domain-containing protein [Kozakia baliensis]
MAFNFGNFDRSADYGSNEEFELLPDGDYEGEIESAESKATRSGGTMIALKIRLDNRRVVFDNLNVECANETAQNIALRQLQTIANYNNVTPNSEEDLEGLRILAAIGTQKGKDGYKDRNVVKYYKGKDDAKKSPAPRRNASGRNSSGQDPRYAEYARANGKDPAGASTGALIDDEIPFSPMFD